ncbi:MAG: tellurite resistance TerB family protein [Alsobacter sp.]
MSLVSTLAKVALGVAVAKGAGYVLTQASAGRGAGPSGGGGGQPNLGDVLGSVLGGSSGSPQVGAPQVGAPQVGAPASRSAPPAPSSGGPDLGSMLDSVLGGGQRAGQSPSRAPAPSAAPSGSGQPSLQDMLGSILGGGGGAGGAGGLPGGLGGLLEQLAGGAAGGGAGAARQGGGAAGGGMGLDAIIGGLASALGGAAAGSAASQGAGGSFGDLLNQALRTGQEPKVAPAPQQEAAAGLMLKAMIQAAKCDGELDEAEKAKIMDALGDASPQDIAFVNRELATPVDVAGLVRQVPKGLEQQVYTVSVLGIDLDSQAEAKYLAALGQALGLDPRMVNAIHAKLGVPALYA